MRPKGKLLVLVAMFAAVGLITATGAFTTVEAQRTAEVNVAGDANALLALSEPDNIPAGSVTGAGSGTATIDLSDSELGDAQGLNADATTELAPLLNVTNNGGDRVSVNVTADVDNSDVEVSVIDTSGNNFTDQDLNSGDSLEFGLRIDIQSASVSDFTIDITINADSSEAGS